ncbi:hypothetical protein [Rahnella selenatireducens]|uniref:hypothetical protein n=1 Tax=Rahnella selenatireducens TaxID=3389797 RepID=UPI003968367C
MEGTTVYSDNSYAGVAVNEIIASMNINLYRETTYKIFFFEKKWISKVDFEIIVSSNADMIIIFCHDSLIRFLSGVISRQVCFALYNSSIHEINVSLTRFFLNQPSSYRKAEGVTLRRNILKPNEHHFISLYMENQSISFVSKFLNIQNKSAYAIKQKILNKLGAVSEMGLINCWEIIADSNY